MNIKLKAMNEVRLPRVAKENEDRKLQAEKINEERLNQNFKAISDSMYEIGEAISEVESEIKQESSLNSTISIKDEFDSGLFHVRKWSNGVIEAWGATLSAVVNCDTASGSLYYGDTTFALPSGLFSSVDMVSVTPVSSEAFTGIVTSYDKDEINFRAFATTSESTNVSANLFIIGK